MCALVSADGDPPLPPNMVRSPHSETLIPLEGSGGAGQEPQAARPWSHRADSASGTLVEERQLWVSTRDLTRRLGPERNSTQGDW